MINNYNLQLVMINNFGCRSQKWILNSAKRFQMTLDIQTSENWKIDFSTFSSEVWVISHIPFGSATLDDDLKNEF